MNYDGEHLAARFVLGCRCLIAAIKEFLASWKEKLKPFIWKATVESIIAKLSRRRQSS